MEKRSTDETTNQSQPCRKHAGIGHLLMMALCCLAPLAAVFALNRLGYDGAAGYLMLLLCPLMHLFMMRGGHGGRTRG
jgi:membrane-bound metal-dependent hydrolase YbcI (DUF457 family)